MSSRPPALLLLALVALAACGPISSTSHYLDARDQFELARAEGADAFAPYEITKAEIYLRKAKELQGRSDYEQSVVFANQAGDMSKKAVEVARKNKARAERLKNVPKPLARPEPVKKVIEVQGEPAPLSPGGLR
jgi:hypothetical protein